MLKYTKDVYSKMRYHYDTEDTFCRLWMRSVGPSHLNMKDVMLNRKVYLVKTKRYEILMVDIYIHVQSMRLIPSVCVLCQKINTEDQICSNVVRFTLRVFQSAANCEVYTVPECCKREILISIVDKSHSNTRSLNHNYNYAKSSTWTKIMLTLIKSPVNNTATHHRLHKSCISHKWPII